jgi:hypothetical protein
MSKTITAETALELLRKARNEKGSDYKYEAIERDSGGTCVYTTPDNEPSCIVGHALAYAGVPLSVLHAIDYGGATVTIKNDYDEYERTYELGMDDTPISDAEVLDWLERNGYELSSGAVDLFRIAQAAQDAGNTWGEAVHRAQNVANAIV